MNAHNNQNIKSFKPSSKSVYKQGYIDPGRCTKIFESQKNKPIIYRSSYEKKFISYLESSPSVLRWASEPICITYINKWDMKQHHYWPDFLVEFTDGTKMLIEIKPRYQTTPPDASATTNMKKNFVTNYCKWDAATRWCERNGIVFKILTEKTILKLG